MAWNEIGRGAVVGSKTHPAWYANAALNNPTATATGAAAVTGASAQAPQFDKKRSPKREKAVDVASGAAVGAGAGLAADRAAFYGLKREYLKPKNRAGQNGRNAKRRIKTVKTEADEKFPNNARKREHYKNANWPDGFKDSKLRHLAAKRTGGKNAAALAVLGAATGAAAAVQHNKKDKVKKVMADHSDSPFLISKAENKKPPSAGRMALGTAFGPYHGLFAGKGAGGKAKSAGTQLVGSLGGGVAGAALTRGNLVGQAMGGAAGAAGGTALAHKKGWLKRQKKK